MMSLEDFIVGKKILFEERNSGWVKSGIVTKVDESLDEITVQCSDTSPETVIHPSQFIGLSHNLNTVRTTDCYESEKAVYEAKEAR